MIRSLARFAAAGLILASAAVFAFGVTLERQSEAAEHVTEPVATANPTPPTLTPTTPPPPTSTHATPPATTRAADQGSDHDADHDSDHGSDSDRDHHQATTTTPHPTTTAQTPTTSPGVAAGQGDTDADGGGGDHDADGGHEGGQATEAAGRSELVFGLNLESPALVIAAVVVSVLLAIAILTIAAPWLAAVIAAAMLALMALDIREIVHQLGESRTELAAIAVVVALLHLLAGLAAAQVARAGYIRSDDPATAAR